MGNEKKPPGAVRNLLIGVVAVVVLASLALVALGPTNLNDLFGQARRGLQARAGQAGGAAATQHDARFGVAEGYKSGASQQLGVGWTRQIFPWDQIQSGGPTDFHPDQVFDPNTLQGELDSGMQVVGLLQFTPGWAQTNPGDGQRSLPKGLDAAWDSPENTFGQFAFKMADKYRGRVDTWVIWNEPDIRPGDQGGGSAWTFAGGPDEYAKLLRAGYMNIKKANPNATVVFAGTSYWLDKNNGREQFFKRTLDVLANDPQAAANNWYFDAVAYNLYRSPDDIYRIANEARATQQAKGLNKPLWLTETNAMPYDPGVPCADRFAANPSNVSLDVQANYAVQATSLALAAGWERVQFYQITDSDTCNESAIWGLVRDDGTPRPAFTAYRTAIQALAGASNITFAPYERETSAWGTPWPEDPNSYYPNWQVYQVVADKGDQRISVLWNADGSPLRARIPKVGSSATVVDKNGNAQPLSDNGGWYVVDLQPATAKGPFDPDGYYYIGGEPLIIVQSGVPGGTPVSGPALGDPGSGQRDFKVFVNPENGQKAVGGSTAHFDLQIRGFEGFSDQVSIHFKEYSTQRDPTPVGSLPSTLQLSVPATANAGDTVGADIQVGPGIANGIHYVTLEVSGGGITKTVDLVVQVD